MALRLSILSLLASIALDAEIDGLNFPFSYGDRPAPFNLSVDPDFIRQTLQKVASYRPSIAVQDYPEWNDGAPPQDKQINSNFSHYTTSVPGSRNYSHTIPLHFIHERSTQYNATPLLLLHGWPSSHLEWSQVVKPLAHPNGSEPAYHVVTPDIPGFGFNPAPEYAGLGPQEMGDAMDRLMKQLGCTSYGIVTTDLGWFVGNWMVLNHADSIKGHMSDFAIVFPNATDLARFAANQTTPEENRYIAAAQAYQGMNSGYATIQSTRPMSLALALTDSPVGFTGWIWQIFEMASDGFGYTYDELITSTMMLWIQGVFGNIRTYKEFWQPTLLNFPKTNVPTGLSEWGWTHGPYPDMANAAFAPKDWIERFAPNLQYFVRHDSGGHFPAISQPQLWVEDVRQFFDMLE